MMELNVQVLDELPFGAVVEIEIAQGWSCWRKETRRRRGVVWQRLDWRTRLPAPSNGNGVTFASDRTADELVAAFGGKAITFRRANAT